MIDPWVPRAVVGLAVAIGAGVAVRAPEHAPIAIGLGVSLILDCVRARVALPYPIAVALCCVPHALGSWIAARVFVPEVPDAGVLAAIGCALVLVLFPSASQPVWALGASVAVQAALARAWRGRRQRLTVSTACCVVLLVGDMAGLLGPAGPLPWARSWAWLTAVQAALVAIVLVGVQGAWLVRGRGTTRARRPRAGARRTGRG